MSELVSAIIPTYNRADLLVRALQSVAAQGYRPIEAVVIDDGSTDGTDRVLEQQRSVLATQGIPLITHHQQNGRAPKARNVGMKLANGTLYAFLDSDDLWRPSYVATLVRLLTQHPQAGLAFSGITVIDPDDRGVRPREMRLPAEPREAVLARPFDSIIRYMPMQTSGVMVRRSVIEALGDFDLDLPVVEDWDLWYRIAKQYDFVYTTEPLACNREHPDNLPKYSVMALNSNLRMNLKHLPDVLDPQSRRALEERIRLEILLLQEQLLREGRNPADYVRFLDHELAPRSLRYRMGRLMLRGPSALGRAYAGAIRSLGMWQRGQLRLRDSA